MRISSRTCTFLWAIGQSSSDGKESESGELTGIDEESIGFAKGASIEQLFALLIEQLFALSGVSAST